MFVRIGDGALAAKLKIDRARELAKARAKAYTPTKGLRLDLLRVLAEIASYQNGKWEKGKKRWGAYRLHEANPTVWTIVSQAALLEWYLSGLRRAGHWVQLSIRTLGYHLAGLKRAGYIKPDSQRHTRARRPTNSRKFDFHPSIFTFTPLGRWVLKNKFSLGSYETERRVGLQNSAESGFNPEVVIRKDVVQRPVDKSPTGRPKRKGRAGARRTRPGRTVKGARAHQRRD